METLDFAMNFEDAQQNEADKKLLVLFFREAIKDETASIQAGRPIFKEVDMVKIITPGSRDSFIGDATEEYQQRFAAQWARYKAGRDQTQSGTPLNLLPWMTIAQVAEFNAVGCHTVEQLVGMSDALSQKFMGHHQIKQKAQAFLEAANNAAPMHRLQAELEKRDETIKQMQDQIQALITAQAKVPTKA